ncbi:MAG: methionyl-tRNA formyltransferase [Planctomycetes bacterium]|nr:methionyl-tRNA formyltransferase [Planctomycetota bacterium]MCB9934634.1 methionyl-tRNA formyltransferase [Planctomycetota bacterium]
MRTVFLGTPEIALPTLRAMAASSEFRPLAVFTQPAARRSRRGGAESSPVGVEALRLGLPVHEVEAVSGGEALQRLVELRPEVIVVVAFGQILKKAVLNLPRHGCLNFHPSMLPKYRGAAPVQRAVLDGVVESGLTIMRLVRRLDAGPILLQRPWRLDPGKNADELLAEAGELGAPMMLEALGRLESGITAVEQDEAQVSFAPPLEKADGELRLSESATQVVNRIRAVQPWPKAETWLKTDDGGELRVLIHRAEIAHNSGSGAVGEVLAIEKRGIVIACGQGAVCFTEIQLEGKPRKPARDVANGLRLKPGAKFRG